MLQTIEMNYESIIFDQPEGKTINGIPVGALSESRPQILDESGKPPPIDLQKIVEAFHSKDGKSVMCVYSDLPADGLVAVDGNPSNFLITNLEPINKAFVSGFPALPKGTVTGVFRNFGEEQFSEFDLELEVTGLAFQVERRLHALTIPLIPHELGLAYSEAKLLWLWNTLTKEFLLKGLTKLTLHNRITDTSVSLTNKAVMEFVIRSLQQDDILNKEQQNEQN